LFAVVFVASTPPVCEDFATPLVRLYAEPRWNIT